jgi:hypothetical protein
MLIGRTIVISFYLDFTLDSTPQAVVISMPSGFMSLGYSANAFTSYQGAGLIQTTPSGNTLNLYRDNTGATPWTTGRQHASGTATFAIA